MTFKQCAEAYVAAHRAGWRNDKHAAQWSATLETYAYPTLGGLPVASVDVGLVLKVLEPIWSTKSETASRLRGRIEAVLDWAKVRGFREGENPARWKGNIDHLLPARAEVKAVEHHAALPYAEIGAFMAQLRNQPGMGAFALRFAILTAARTGEVLGTRWDEIDLKNAVWTIPAGRMKAGREHRVPLSSPAVTLLEELAKAKAGEFVFFGQRTVKPLSNMALLMTLRRMKCDDLTAHGFRSTFRDWAAEQTSASREVAEAALAHTLADKVEAAYRRSDLFDKRRALMADWAAYCLPSPS
jgi:integrase